MIESQRLRLVPCDDTIFDAIRMGDSVLSKVIGVNVPKKWTEFRDAFTPAYNRWKEHPPLRDWWTHLIILKPDNLLIGSCGYKGEPDVNGVVEIGYEIKATFREKGYGTEAACALAAHAFRSSMVSLVVAHTLPFENPSVSVLRKAGFQKVSEITDEADGLVWRWEKHK